ncbi:MAG: 50S ribosomal protein L6 [Patescibacteria group bacterium]
MSRIGKQIITIPEKTNVTVADGAVVVRGPLGELSRPVRKEVAIEVKDKEVSVVPHGDDIFTRALWGTTAAHIKNMVAGVNAPFVKSLLIEGVGYRAELLGGAVVLSIGFSHPVKLPIPTGIKVTIDKGKIVISGIDKEAVGQFTAKIRAQKKPEPYKGKGIRYEGEVVRRKQGKKAA